MRKARKVPSLIVIAMILSLFTGSLIAESSTSTSQDVPMGQAPKPIPPSKDAYGSVSSMGSGKGMKSSEETAMPTHSTKSDEQAKKMKQINSSKRQMMQSNTTDAQKTMKPIKINPNPPGSPLSGDGEDTNLERVEDTMNDHKESKFLLDSSK